MQPSTSYSFSAFNEHSSVKQQRVLHFVTEVSVPAVSGTRESVSSTLRTLLSVGHQAKPGGTGVYNMNNNNTATD